MKQLVAKCFRANHFIDDIFSKEHRLAGTCDLYVAGFPCQPFSSEGSHGGLSDKHGRGIVIFAIIEYLKHNFPVCFLLENVDGIKAGANAGIFQDRSHCFAMMLSHSCWS